MGKWILFLFFADVISDESFHAKRQWHGGKGQFPKTKKRFIFDLFGVMCSREGAMVNKSCCKSDANNLR